jgi:hypothetical protein
LNFQRIRIGNEVEELRRIEGLGFAFGLGGQRIDGRADASRLESEITELQLQNSSLAAQIAQGRASHAEEEEEEEELGASPAVPGQIQVSISGCMTFDIMKEEGVVFMPIRSSCDRMLEESRVNTPQHPIHET